MTNPNGSWPLTPLHKVTTKIGSGLTPLGGRESYKHEGIALIRSQNVYDFHFEDDGLAFIDDEQAKKLANVQVEPGDILLNITGASVARCCMVPQRLLPARVNQHVAIVRAAPNLAVPGFVFYCINSPRYKHHLLTLAQGGATREALTKETIENFEVPLPPLPTQVRIASVLSAYDDLIENNTRRIAILEEMARSLYREWFVNFRFPGHDDVKMVDSSFGPVPSGWSVMNLSQLVTTQYGYTESASTDAVGPKFLRGMDINKNTYIDWDAVPYCPIDDKERDRYRLSKGDIVVIRMADPGKVGIVEQDVDAVFASYLIRLAVTSPFVRPYYLFHFLVSERYQDYVTGASTGTTRKSASAGVMTAIDLPLPPDPLLRRFEELVTDLRMSLNALLAKNSVLRGTRDLLLPRLISGELDVSDLDIDTGGLSA